MSFEELMLTWSLLISSVIVALYTITLCEAKRYQDIHFDNNYFTLIDNQWVFTYLLRSGISTLHFHIRRLCLGR